MLMMFVRRIMRGSVLLGCEKCEGCSLRLYSSEPPRSKAPWRHGETEVAASVKGEIQKVKKKFTLFPQSAHPLNFSFPNKKGVYGYDPEMDVKEMLEVGPAILKKNFKMFGKEIVESFSIQKKEAIENQGFLKHGEARKEFTFDTPEALSIWKTGCDSDWSEGYSTCEFVQTDRRTAVFRGKICTQPIKDGRVQRAGWATIKLEDRAAFLRKKYFSRWASFSHFLIKCRGDGRSYKVMLHTPGAIDLTWGDSYSYPLHTHGGPYWQYERIPFSRFFHTVAGRIQDVQSRIICENVSSIGIVLMDRIDGEFSLEIDFIGVCHDRSHLEKFAYETYTIPLFNPSGI